mgnify:CR=1 FL=1
MLLDVDPVVLDELLEDDCNCQIRHTRTACTNDVVARLLHCGGYTLMCDAATRGKKAEINLAQSRCSRCKRDVEKCWQVVPA